MFDVAMDPDKTAPFELGDGPDAVLLIHGFTGSPWDMRPLGEALALRGYHVRGIRLPGHGVTPRAMTGVDHRDWEAAVEDGLHALGDKRRVFIAGLSMGALLALIATARHPDQVHGLALLAPALRFKGRTLTLIRKFRSFPLLFALRPWVEKTASDIEDPTALADAPILRAWPSERLADLWKVQDHAREAMPRITAPSLIAISAQDHVVAADGGRELARGLVNAPVRFIQLTRGFHIQPRDLGKDVLFAEVDGFFDRLRPAPQHGAAVLNESA